MATGLFDFGHSVGVAEFPFKIYHFPFYILLGIIGRRTHAVLID